jgi:hypothetical protein
MKNHNTINTLWPNLFTKTPKTELMPSLGNRIGSIEVDSPNGAKSHCWLFRNKLSQLSEIIFYEVPLFVNLISVSKHFSIKPRLLKLATHNHL